MIFDHPQAKRPIKRWVYCITGFLQTAGTRTRVIDLWRGLDALTGNDTRIELRTWCADWEAEAELVLRTSSIDGPAPLVLVFGYSWGGGWGAMQFAKALDDRELLVRHMVLSDPVFRYRYWYGQWRTFFPFIPIYVPSNVQNVDYFRQVRDWPRAHPLIARNADLTRVSEPVTLNANHVNMDESPTFLRKCEEVAIKYIDELFPPVVEPPKVQP